MMQKGIFNFPIISIDFQIYSNSIAITGKKTDLKINKTPITEKYKQFLNISHIPFPEFVPNNLYVHKKTAGFHPAVLTFI